VRRQDSGQQAALHGGRGQFGDAAQGGDVSEPAACWGRERKKEKNAPWEIYNLALDVNETTDLAKSQPELVKQMEVIMKREHQSSHIKEWEFVDPKFSAKK
jgi:hypothetical protein